MAISVECASRLFLGMWFSLHLLTFASIIAVASPKQWCGADGLFSSQDPPRGLMVGRGLALLGVTSIGMSLVVEWVCLLCCTAEFFCVKCFRGSTFLGALSGFLGSLIGVTHMPEYEVESMGTMAITAIASFALTGVLTGVLAAFCDDCCPAPARYLRGEVYSSQDRAAMTQIQVRGIRYWFMDKGSQALSALRRQRTDPNVAQELQEAAQNLNVPAEDVVGHVRDRQDASPSMPEGYQPAVPNPSHGNPVQQCLDQVQRVGSGPVYKPRMVPGLEGIQEESESGRSSPSTGTSKSSAVSLSDTFKKSSETRPQESDTSSQTLTPGASPEIQEVKEEKRPVAPLPKHEDTLNQTKVKKMVKVDKKQP